MKTNILRSIGFKILFFYTLLALTNVSFIVTIIFENQVDLIAKNAKLESERQISNLIGSLKKFSSEMKRGTLFGLENDRHYRDQFIDVIRPYAPSFFLISEDGAILHRSKNPSDPPPAMAEDMLRSLTAENFSGKEYYLRIDDRKKLVYVYIPLGNFSISRTILLVVKDIRDLDSSLGNLYRQAIYVVTVALFFHAVFALLLFRYIINPVRNLEKGAEKLSEGDFSARIALADRSDEFGSLAASFNRMADSVSRNMTALSNKAKNAIDEKNRTDITSIRDELTGLFRRIYMIERINEETARARIKKSRVALLFIDIDDFEDIYKIYGDNSGNIIVLEISKIAVRHCAETETVARFSRESIAVLITDSAMETVRDLAERIRQDIEKAVIITPERKFSVTASIGIACLGYGSPERPDAESDLVFSAGTALARARAMGKNRVEIVV